MDLDNFKLVNDLYGHAMGDKILVRFAELIKGMIRSTDLAGRIGGDEFIAFCQGVRDEKIIFDKASFLNHHLLLSAKNFMGEDMNIPLGTSIGAVFVPFDGTNFDSLTVKADKALYKVKHHGKHGCAFFGEENDPSAEHKSLSQTKIILSERNREAGALFVNFEKFKAIYQFAARQPNSTTQFLMMTLEADDDTCDKFLDVLIKILPRTDCVTQHGRDQFFALINGMLPEKISSLQQKISAAWKFAGSDVEIIFESGNIL